MWPCAQTTSQWQRHDRYLPASHRHPAKMLPALARRAIETYSDPGVLVVDPMCGIGTTLVEAIHLGRRAVGVELEGRWARLAALNVRRAQQHGATGRAQVITGDAHGLARLLSTRAQRLLADDDGEARSAHGLARIGCGQADLILTSPPYACHVADVDTENLHSGRGSIRREDTANYSLDRRNLGHARGGAYLDAMSEIYAACAAVLKPGGFLVLVTKEMRFSGRLGDLAGQTVTLCQQAGLLYWQHVIALHATIRDGQLLMRPSFWQTLHARRLAPKASARWWWHTRMSWSSGRAAAARRAHSRAPARSARASVPARHSVKGGRRERRWRAVGVAGRAASRAPATPAPLSARLERAPRQDAARARTHGDRALHPPR